VTNDWTFCYGKRRKRGKKGKSGGENTEKKSDSKKSTSEGAGRAFFGRGEPKKAKKIKHFLGGGGKVDDGKKTLWEAVTKREESGVHRKSAHQTRGSGGTCKSRKGKKTGGKFANWEGPCKATTLPLST